MSAGGLTLVRTPMLGKLLDKNESVSQPWKAYFDFNYNVNSSLLRFGNTANQPTTNLWVGQQYFNTDLGRPVWCTSTSPIVWTDTLGSILTGGNGIVVSLSGSNVLISTNLFQSSAPTSNTAPGTQGTYFCDSNYLYFCIAINTWVRIPVTATF